MDWKAPEKTCTNCGHCFGDYGSDCSWPNGCYGFNGEMRGWKERKPNRADKAGKGRDVDKMHNDC